MYTRNEASLIRQKFWTAFGLYMRPILNANGDRVNWINYKTGIRNIYFRMDADNKSASLGIELKHKDQAKQQEHFEQLNQFRTMLEEITGEEWQWKNDYTAREGSSISIAIAGVNIFKEEDWPKIISFLKPRIIALDTFWMQVKDFFEE